MSTKLHTAFKLKIALIHYFRFARHYSLVASEVRYSSGGIADILASDYKYIIEVEIKCTKQDFIKDFDKKVGRYNVEKKHEVLENRSKDTPNKFFFCVPESLKKFAVDYLETHNNKYGLLSCDPSKKYTYSFLESMGVVKSAKVLHNEYSKRLEEKIINRCSSELSRLYTKYYEEYVNKQGVLLS